MDYKHEQNIDNEFTAAWVLKIVNRAMNRVPGFADDFPTPTVALSETNAGSASFGTSKAIKIDQTGTHTGTYGQITPEPDGSVTEFFVEEEYLTGKCEVYKNGKGLIQGTGEDWVEGNGLMSVIIVPAPLATDIITTASLTELSAGSLVESQTGGTGDSYQEFVEIPNGGRTTFTLKAGAFFAETMRLYERGKLQIEGAAHDFTMDGDAGQVTFSVAPLTGADLEASAEKKTGIQIDQSGGTADTFGVIGGAIPGTAYTTSELFDPTSLIVSKNGKRLTQGSDGVDDYYMSGNQRFILNDPTIATDELSASYEIFKTLMVGAVKVGTTDVATTYTVTGSDMFVLCDASGGAFTVTLPDAATRIKQIPVTIKKTDASANTVTVDTTGADTLENEADQELVAEGDAIICMSDGLNYWVG